MDPIIRKMFDALREERKAADVAWSSFEAARESAKSEGADVTSPETFERLDSLHREYAMKADAVKSLEAKLEAAHAWAGEAKASPFAVEEKAAPQSSTPGDRFILSATYKGLVDSGVLNVDRAPINALPTEILSKSEFKTLVTGAGSQQGGAFVINDRIPGLAIDLPRETPRIASLITVGTTDSDTVEWVEQTARTNAAAETAENSAAPESAVEYTVKTTPVEEVTHFIPVTRRALADAGIVRTLLDSELREGINERIDNRLLNGSGASPNFTGILNTTGVNTQDITGLTRADAVLKAMTAIRLDYYEPDAILMNPQDFEAVRLSKTTGGGDYLFGSPAIAGATTLWGLPVFTSTRIASGTTLVGNFRRGAQMWVREGLSVAASDSHDDYFLKRKVALLATMRAAFTVVRPSAFCVVSDI